MREIMGNWATVFESVLIDVGVSKNAHLMLCFFGRGGTCSRVVSLYMIQEVLFYFGVCHKTFGCLGRQKTKAVCWNCFQC